VGGEEGGGVEPGHGISSHPPPRGRDGVGV
jgi:hypothetical protein